MNTELTSFIQIVTPQKVSDSYSSKKDYNTDNSVFSDTLDKVKKSYVDKTENTFNKDKKDCNNNIETDKNTTEIQNKENTEQTVQPENADTTQQTDQKEEQNNQQESKQLQGNVAIQQLVQNQEIINNTIDGNLTESIAQNNNKNLILNEQLIANINYESSTDTDAMVIDEKTLKAILEKAQKAEENKISKNLQSASTPLSTLNQNALSSATNTETVETTVTNTSTDAEADKTPLIKVTAEVAANTKENTTTGIENKDAASKIKDKAVAQMASLENTNTVVTQSQTTDSSNQNGKSLSQNNAQEQIAKMAVEANSNNTQTVANLTSDVFMNKLDAQLNMAPKATPNQLNQLTQNSIMEQVNKQFEQLQQSSSNKVSIILQPENLGRVSVEIMNSKDGIVAKMLTDNQQVKDLFDKNVEALKSNLSSQGINVNNIKVECTPESSNNAMNFGKEQFNQTFDNNQNHHNNQANQSTSISYNSTETETSDFEETEKATANINLTSTQTIIKHNGKVDYKV